MPTKKVQNKKQTGESHLSDNKEIEEIYNIIKILSARNITRLLYFARGLSKNGG